jgi:outer membrane lipopolysaccharide assembly protein LptE/RlpB
MLSACGFHLRGAADLPFKTMYLALARRRWRST